MQSFAKGLSHKRIRRQSGSVAMLGALWLMVAVICLATIDIGNVFWQKRELQKIADLAALAGASGDLNAGSCAINSKANALKNGYEATPKATTGRWGVIKDKYEFLEGNYTYNACKVEVLRSVPYFFIIAAGSMSSRDVSATAIAKQIKARVARVDIKSQLLSLKSQDSKVLNLLVNGVLGGNIDLGVAGWQGLADADISLLTYLDALALRLNIKSGNYQELLKTGIGLGDILNVMAEVASRNKFLDAAANILKIVDLSPGIKKTNIKLGDLLKLSSPFSDAGLNANVNLLELLTASLQIAGKDQAISLGLPVDLGPLANASLKLKVIQPPQWGIGDPLKDKIFAKTAQIELSLDTSALFDFLKLGLDISVADGYVEVVDFYCSSENKKLYVDSKVSVVKINLNASLIFDILKKKFPEINVGGSQDKNLLLNNVKMVQEKIDIWIPVGQEKKIIGSLVDGVISWVTSLILLPPFDKMANDFIKSITSPLTDLLDLIINGLLKALGIGLGNAYIAGRLTCGYEADLVY